MIHNIRGFTNVLILLFFSIFLTSLLILIAGAEQIKTQKKLFQICQKEGLNYQHQVSEQLNKLMSLNPQAEKLIIEKKIQEALLAEAIATGNIELTPIIQAKINNIKIRQVNLSQKQYKFIYLAKTILANSSQKTESLLMSEFKKIQNVQKLLKIQPSPQQQLYGSIPIRATSLEIAPVYEPLLPSEKISLMDHSWQLKLSLTSPWNKWLSSQWSLKKQCLVGISYKNKFLETTVVRL